MAAECTVTVEHADPPLVVLAGEVNYESAFHIRDALKLLVECEGKQHVVIDCRFVDFIDSSGIGTIVHVAQRLKRTGGVLRLKSPTAQLVHALQVSGFAEMVEVESPVSRRAKRNGDSIRMPGTWQHVSFCVPLRAERDGIVRRRVTELAESMPFTREELDDIRLAVGEATSNALRHGCRDHENDRLTVRCTGDSEKLCVEIHNPGEPFDADSIPVPNPEFLLEGGMGIFFMKKSMDSVEFHFDETGTTVAMVKYVSKNGEEQ
ncbi:MAG: anti-sigma factor antagonist [Armatimonadetes bacterium]|nr:anti-sigma factor antagonist [Armatimonadota bacterium]